MEIKKIYIFLASLFTFIMVLVLDLFDFSTYVDITKALDSTISNLINFAAILIGFISTIYVMIQQTPDSHVLRLLKNNELDDVFNLTFKNYVYIGFIDVIALIILNFSITIFIVFKTLCYIILPLSVYFILMSNNLVVTVCKIVISENKLKNKKNELNEKDLKI